MEIDLQNAVQIARKTAIDLFKEEIIKKEIQNLMLEEVEFDEDNNQWLITLGYDSTGKIIRKLGTGLFPEIEEKTKREYKIFKIDSNSGEFISMKIRNV